MSDTLGSLMEKNLSDVFGQRDFTRRVAAIAELTPQTVRFSRRMSRSTAEKRSTRRSGVFSRMPPDLCFARQSLRRSITILAVCDGSSGRPPPRQLSRVRTLRSLSTEKSEA